MSKLKVVRKNHYSTVIAIEKIFKGESILKLEGIKSFSPTKYSIQIGEHEHCMPYSSHPDIPSSFFRFICE